MGIDLGLCTSMGLALNASVNLGPGTSLSLGMDVVTGGEIQLRLIIIP